ncbi:MAG: hypothetical protein [Microvirus sp.]|nr:MAG: hypothetical protein [Microvirus sp.]
MEYKHSYNSGNSKGQTFICPSETVQGQTLSIAQMLDRIQNGVPVKFNQLQYTDEDYPEPRVKDLTDLDDIKNEIDFFKQNLQAIENQRIANEKAKLNTDVNKSADGASEG